jgi:hypothetical protein
VVPFGSLHITLENEPSSTNPKSSERTVLSLVRLIERQLSPIVIKRTVPEWKRSGCTGRAKSSNGQPVLCHRGGPAFGRASVVDDSPAACAYKN